MDHIPTSSHFPDHSLTGRGFYLSSPGDSPPAPFLDARGPSVTFAPIVSVCKVPPPTSEIPASCMVSSLPLVPPANPVKKLLLAEPPPVITVPVPPPAEPPPPVLLPLLDFSLSCSSIQPEGSLLHRMVHDGPLSPPSPFDKLTDGWDTMALVLLPDSPRGPRSVGSVHRVVTCPRVLGFQGSGRSYARINLAAMATSATPGRLIDGGANICIAGDIDSLFDMVAIPPLSISVAVEGASSIDDRGCIDKILRKNISPKIKCKVWIL